MAAEPREVTVRSALPSDIPRVVEIHLDAFPSFFLTSLGFGFLRLLYSEILCDPTGILYIAESKGCVCGFVGGTTHPAGLYSRLIKRRVIAFAAASVWPAIKRPKIMFRLFRAISKARDAEGYGGETALLMSIAVDPAGHGSGVGAALVRSFVQKVAESGARSVVLTTDALNNETVNRFYLRHGFELQRTYLTPEGRKMNEYARAL